MRRTLFAAGSVLVIGAVLAWGGHRAVPFADLGRNDRDTVVTAPVAPITVESPDTLRRGETLAHLFERNGVGAAEVRHLASLLDLRRLRAGLVFNIRRPHADSAPDQITVRTGPEQRLRLTRLSTAWQVSTEPIRWTTDTVRFAGAIESSLYEALDRAVPTEALPEGERTRLAWALSDVFAWQLDFSRDLQPGDAFEVLIERLTSEEGERRLGVVLAANLEVNGNAQNAYRFVQEDRPGYFDAQGRSLRRAFLRAPVEFRRISSRFNRARFHPILGYARRHDGTDYAADPGTPVMAAGNGTVTNAGWSGGYGKLVELRHANGITTRYGHLRGFATGIHAGATVVQGQVIGYVGTTGLSTGPHLHYEFRVNGVSRDPARVDLGTGVPIAPALKPSFDAARIQLVGLLLPAPTGVLAATPPAATPSR